MAHIPEGVGPRYVDGVSPSGLRCWVFGLFLVALGASAWMHDDAYITFRTVDNFLHGHGLTWNVVERVQAFTHPLWMFLHVGLFAVTGEAYFTSLGFSMVLSALVVYLLLFRFEASAEHAAVVGFLLVSCKSFVDYSTSGLENPLTHLLIVLFALTWLRASDDVSFRVIFQLSLVAGLAAFNRLDTILFFIPTLSYLLLRHRSWQAVAVSALGFLPPALWQLFSLVYYGFLFPNTAYAKLGIGAPRAAALDQGVDYLFYTFLNDPVTILVLCAATYGAVRVGPAQGRWILAGCGLYLAYAVWIGGDYMAGRFLSAPVVAAATVLLSVRWPRPSRRQVRVGLAILGLLLLRSATAAVTRPWHEFSNVGDERQRFYHATGWVKGLFADKPWPDHFFRRKGEYARRHGPTVVVDAYVGLLGFHAGPEIHIVDLLGLPDPLLARLPGRFSDHSRGWLPGHVARPLPAGFVESLETGENRIADPRLAVFYDRLRLVTRGELWTRERWLEILRFHRGGNASLVDAYVESHSESFTGSSADLQTLFTIDRIDVLNELPSSNDQLRPGK